MGNQRPSCSISDADLLRYEDGTLSHEHHITLDAHITTCPRCQERLAAAASISQLLRASLQPVHDPAGEARLLAELRRRDRQPRPGRMAGRITTVPAVVALSLLVIIVTGITLQETTTADFRLGRVVHFVADSDPATQREGQPLDGRPLTTMESSTAKVTAITPVVPEALPHGLTLVERIDLAPARVVAHYAAASGLAIRVGQEPARPNMTVIGTGRTKRIVVRQTEIIIERDTLGSIVRAVWEREQLFFDLVILEPGPDAVTTDDVSAIVDTLLSAQRGDR